jgi:hypothetical protein
MSLPSPSQEDNDATVGEMPQVIDDAGQRTQPTETRPATWSPEVEHLLEDWRNRVYAAQAAHYASADQFRLLNYFVGVPAAIFSSIVGTALFTGLEKGSPQTLLIGSVSIMAAVLAALQTFLRFAERASQHATAGDWYSAIRRDIEELLHLARPDRGSPKECLDEVRKEMNRVGQNSPELSGPQWRRQAKRFRVKEPQLRL